MFLFWKNLKKVRALVTLIGEVVAGFNFACSACERQKRHVIIQQCSNQVHSYNTRFSSAGNHCVNPSRTNVRRNSISRLGPNLCNSLNNTTRELPRKSFKTEVHNMLLSFLASEDIYIVSPSIIQKLLSTSPQ